MKRSNLVLAIFCIAADLVAVLVGLVLAYFLRADGTQLYFWSFGRYLTLAFWTLPVWAIAFSLQGLYNPRKVPTGWNSIGRAIAGILVGWGLILIILYLWRTPEALVLSRLLIVYAIILTAGSVITDKAIISITRRILLSANIGMIRCVIIDQSSDDIFVRQLKDEKRHGREVVAVLPVEGVIERLNELAKTSQYDEIIVAKSHIDEKTLFEILDWAENNSKGFAHIPSMMSVRATNVEVSNLANTPIMFFPRTPLEGWGRVAKRLLDLVLVTPSLVVFLPFMFIAGLFVKLTSSGPVFYKQERTGQDGKMFFVHKFRSMYDDWQQRFPSVRDWSTDETKDPRVTPIGKFFRKTMIDELPQLWDVFIGRMSLVGPRPEQPKYVDKFAKEVPNYFRRHFVKSGLTGWAQINGLRGDTSVAERVKYDLFYIENWSIWFDLRIILATFAYILRAKT